MRKSLKCAYCPSGRISVPAYPKQDCGSTCSECGQVNWIVVDRILLTERVVTLEHASERGIISIEFADHLRDTFAAGKS